VQRIRKRLTYANVISSLALFLVVAGGSAFAASQLGKNTVGSKQLKKNAVTAAKIKKEAITGAKVKKGSLTGTQINSATLGNVPSATNATNASVASSLTPAEGLHIVGTAGNPSFENGSNNLAAGLPINLPPIAFWKDKEGMVHLQGYAKNIVKPSSIFTLPPGFRPAAGAVTIWEQGGPELAALIGGTGASLEALELSGRVVGVAEETILEGISFRAGS